MSKEDPRMLVYPGDEKDSLCGLKSKVPLSLWYIDSYLRHFQLQDSHDPRDLCSVIIIIHIQDLGFRPKPLQPTYAGLGFSPKTPTTHIFRTCLK
jgi:hypothetical protein